MNLCLGEKAPTPFGKAESHLLELMEQDLIWLNMLERLNPSLFDHLYKAGHSNPKFFELEGSRPPRPLVIGEEKRAVIG